MWTNMHGDEFVWDEFVGDELFGDESSGSRSFCLQKESTLSLFAGMTCNEAVIDEVSF